MGTITISLPDEDFQFLQTYSKSRGTSAAELLARQTKALRKQLEQPLHPDVMVAIGTIRPNQNGEREHKNYLEKKHA